jgi:hypothetical protein
MNTRAKGNRIQLKLIKKLRLEGWLVAKTERTGKFIKEKDLFGIGDLICLKKTEGKTKIKIIQSTTNRPHTHKKYKEFAEKFGEEYLKVEQWVWVDRKGWKTYSY